MAEIDGDDLMLLKALRAKVRPQGGSRAKERHAADRKAMLKETDGRRRRGSSTTRDAQINFKVSAQTKADIVEVARRLDQPMVWVLERGLELVLAEEAAMNGGKS